MAQLIGGGLVQLIVSNFDPLETFLFLNGSHVAPQDLESLTIVIDGGETEPACSCILSRYEVGVDGKRQTQAQNLFPCTVEIVAMQRRIRVSAEVADNPESAVVSLGLLADGTDRPISGAAGFRFVLSDGLLDCKITWNDGTSEAVLPQMP